MKDWRPKLSSITDPIAEDRWSYLLEDGTRRTSHILIGRPTLAPDEKTWYCPVSFEHVTAGIKYSFGVGPVDALMNAMYFVRRRFYEFDEVEPGAKPVRARRSAVTSPSKSIAAKSPGRKRATTTKPSPKKR